VGGRPDEERRAGHGETRSEGGARVAERIDDCLRDRPVSPIVEEHHPRVAGARGIVERGPDEHVRAQARATACPNWLPASGPTRVSSSDPV
jgi:hypothetical protein